MKRIGVQSSEPVQSCLGDIGRERILGGVELFSREITVSLSNPALIGSHQVKIARPLSLSQSQENWPASRRRTTSRPHNVV